MSRISEYNLEAKEECINCLKAIFDIAISIKDAHIWYLGDMYAEGLRDAFNAYLDTAIVEEIDCILVNKQIEYQKSMKEELN